MESQAEVIEIRTANNAYYAALSARDLSEMERIWAGTPDDINVAPPTRPVAHIGWDAIKKNYEQFWNTLDELTVTMDEPVIRLNGPVAWVFGVETARRRTRNGQTGGGRHLGTSIFVKTEGAWRLVFHQAGLIPEQE